MKYFRRSAALVLSLALTANANAQTTQPPTSSVPSQIATAHKVFLANAGADPSFPLDSAHVYSDISARMQAWGHYQLVVSAAEADLVFTLRGAAPVTEIAGEHGSVNNLSTPAFELVITDAKSNRRLWTVSSPISLAGKKGKFDHWAGIAETNLVSRVKVLAGTSLTNAETASLTNVPKGHSNVTALLVVGGLVGLAVGGGLLLHHLYENSLADQKAQQDAFCKANNIPLSMCAGG